MNAEKQIDLDQVDWHQVHQLIRAEFTEPAVWKVLIAFGFYALVTLLIAGLFRTYVAPFGDALVSKVRGLIQRKSPGEGSSNV